MSANFEIEQAEGGLRRAMLAGDVRLLDELLGDGMVFTDQDGRRLSKADDMAAHRSGLLKIDRLDIVHGPLIRVIGDSALVNVTVGLAGRYDGQPFDGMFAYTRVWHRADRGWRIEAAHCSSVEEG